MSIQEACEQEYKNNGPLGDFILDFTTRMNESAAKIYQPTCRDCGDKITGISYNGSCGPCSRAADDQDDLLETLIRNDQ